MGLSWELSSIITMIHEVHAGTEEPMPWNRGGENRSRGNRFPWIQWHVIPTQYITGLQCDMLLNSSGPCMPLKHKKFNIIAIKWAEYIIMIFRNKTASHILYIIASFKYLLASAQGTQPQQEPRLILLHKTPACAADVNSPRLVPTFATCADAFRGSPSAKPCWHTGSPQKINGC